MKLFTHSSLQNVAQRALAKKARTELNTDYTEEELTRIAQERIKRDEESARQHAEQQRLAAEQEAQAEAAAELKAIGYLAAHTKKLKALKALNGLPEVTVDALSIPDTATEDDIEQYQKALTLRATQAQILLNEVGSVDDIANAVTNIATGTPEKTAAEKLVGDLNAAKAAIAKRQAALDATALQNAHKAVAAKIKGLEDARRSAAQAAAQKAEADAAAQAAKTQAEAAAQIAAKAEEKKKFAEAIAQAAKRRSDTAATKAEAELEAAKAKNAAAEALKLKAIAETKAAEAKLLEEKRIAAAAEAEAAAAKAAEEAEKNKPYATRALELAKNHKGKIIIGGVALSVGAFALLMKTNPHFRAAVNRHYENFKNRIAQFMPGESSRIPVNADTL